MKDEKTATQLIQELENSKQELAQLKAEKKEWQETAQAAQATAERFRRLFERAPLAYQSLDSDGYLLEANPAWLEMLGYSREEAIGRWFGEFLAPGQVDLFKIRFPQFKAAGEICDVLFEMKRKDGSTLTTLINGRIGYDERGKPQQTHCIVHNITERKQVEAALRASENRMNFFSKNGIDIYLFSFFH